MNLKRWFAWLCLALMLVAEIFLFHANREKDAALTDLHAAQHELRQAQTELEEMKNSNAGLQAAENSRLRKQNEILTNKLAAVQAGLAQAQSDYHLATQQLATARAALGLLQEHLEQLQGEKQRLAVAGATVIQQNACINHLREINDAKQQWAFEKNKSDDAVPTVKNLLPYLKDGVFPACPAGGSYSINAVGELPGCSLPGHVLSP